jgi:hypothetical protein
MDARLHRSISVAMAGFLLAVSPLAARAAETFIALMNSPQEVPPNDSNGHGLVFFTYEGRMLCYAINYTELGSDEIAAHIHGPAEPGVNAAVLFPISPDPSPLGSPKQGCLGPLTAAQGRDLERGLLYVNIHTTEFPNGEIRGQIIGGSSGSTGSSRGRLPVIR